MTTPNEPKSQLEQAWPVFSSEPWPGEEQALAVLIQRYEDGVKHGRWFRLWLRRAQQIIDSAYATPEWMRNSRTDYTDDTALVIRDYLAEFEEELKR